MKTNRISSIIQYWSNYDGDETKYHEKTVVVGSLAKWWYSSRPIMIITFYIIHQNWKKTSSRELSLKRSAPDPTVTQVVQFFLIWSNGFCYNRSGWLRVSVFNLILKTCLLLLLLIYWVCSDSYHHRLQHCSTDVNSSQISHSSWKRRTSKKKNSQERRKRSHRNWRIIIDLSSYQQTSY